LLPRFSTPPPAPTAGIYSGIGEFTIPGVSTITVTAEIAIVLVVFTYLLIAALLRSPIGQAIEALKAGTTQAEARGISFLQHRVIVFTVSAFLTGLAGGLYTHFSQGVTPAVFDVGLLINLFAMLALGGVGSRVGPIIGAVIGVYVNDRLSASGQYSQLIWGGILLLTVMVAPGGLVGVAEQGFEWLRRALRGGNAPSDPMIGGDAAGMESTEPRRAAAGPG
jgi:ABC-type branched-subunit amino acid transport system permease subunit